jgi:hypothetical protein
MIPKIFHRIWFGSGDMPEPHEKWWQAWRRQYPSYEFVTWTDKDIETLSHVKEKIFEANGFARKSDIARYEILRLHGGVYIDTDFMPVNYFDFAGCGARIITCGPVHNDSIVNGFFAISKDHIAMTTAVNLLNKTELNKGNVCHETGPKFFGTLIRPFECKRLPWQAMYPYNHNESFSSIYMADLSDTVGIHAWHGSWYSQDLQLAKIHGCLSHGDMTELESAASYINIHADAAQMIKDTAANVRAIRTREIDCARDSWLDSLITYDKSPVFDVFKMSTFLFTDRPGSVIWNIGAGDGIRRDKLRPTIIKYVVKNPGRRVRRIDSVGFPKRAGHDSLWSCRLSRPSTLMP